MRDLPRGTQVTDRRRPIVFVYGAVTLYGLPFLTGSTNDQLFDFAGTLQCPEISSYNPSSETAATYRAELVWAIPISLATTPGMFSFPPATEMFQFAGLPPPGLFGSARSDWTSPAGFPHSDTLGSKHARCSPRHFAAYHVLHRLLAPRHPPRALCSLTSLNNQPKGRAVQGDPGSITSVVNHGRN